MALMPETNGPAHIEQPQPTPPPQSVPKENPSNGPAPKSVATEKSIDAHGVEGAVSRETSVNLARARQKGAALGDRAGLPRIRTYATDMNRAIKERGATLSSIVTAEKKQAREKAHAPEAVNSRGNRRRLIAIGAALLILLGVGSIIAVVVSRIDSEESSTTSTSIIFTNHTTGVIAGNDLPGQLNAVRTGVDMSLGEITRIIVTENDEELPPSELALRVGLPETLAREVSGIMLGIHAFDRNQPFIILSVGAFDRSFNALLDAEAKLGVALGAFFAPVGGAGNAPTLTFKDAIIRNIDVRKSEGGWPILYAYPTRTLIVITTNEFTLREVLTRLGNQTR